MNIKAIFSRIKENEKYPCPYCGEKAISYGKKVKCWPMIEVRCPECDAIIKQQKKYRIIDIVIIVLEFIIGMIAIDRSGDTLRVTALCLFLLPSLLYRSIVPLFTELEYEEDAKHPKPVSENKEDN